jgi:hypothetical protein
MQRLRLMVSVFVVAGAASAATRQGVGVQPISTVGAMKTVDNKAEPLEKAKPKIQSTEFGSITIGGTVYTNDVVIRLDGKVEKRKKKLSKQETGTSHIISLDEAKHVYQEGAVRLIVGTGQSGMVRLSDEAAGYFKRKRCSVELLPTPAAIRVWNEAKGAVIGLFHVTC